MLLFLLSALVSSICDLPSNYEFTDFQQFFIGSQVNIDADKNPECIPRYREQVEKGNHYYDWRVNYLVNNDSATIDFIDMVPYNVEIFAYKFEGQPLRQVNIKWQSNSKEALYNLKIWHIGIILSGDPNKPLNLDKLDMDDKSNIFYLNVDSRPGVILNSDAFGYGGDVGKYEDYFSAVYFYFDLSSGGVSIGDDSMKYPISIYLEYPIEVLPITITEELKIIIQTSSYQVYRKSTDCSCSIYVPYLKQITITNSNALLIGLDSNHPPNFPDISNKYLMKFINPSSIIFLDNSAPKHVNPLFYIRATSNTISLYFQGSDPSVEISLSSYSKANLYFSQANTYIRSFSSNVNVNLINENGNMAYIFIPNLNFQSQYISLTKNVFLVIGDLKFGYNSASYLGNFPIPIRVTKKINLYPRDCNNVIELKEYSIIEKTYFDKYNTHFQYLGTNYLLINSPPISDSTLASYINHTIYKSTDLDLIDFAVSFRDYVTRYYYSNDIYKNYRLQINKPGSFGQWSQGCVYTKKGESYFTILSCQTKPISPKELTLIYGYSSSSDIDVKYSDWKRTKQYPETKRIILRIYSDYAIPDSFNLDNTVYTNIDLQVEAISSSTPRTFNLDVTNIGNRIRTLTLNSIKLVITGGKKNNDLIDLNFESLILDSLSTIDEGTIERCNFNKIKRVELPYDILKKYSHKFEACDSVSVSYTGSSSQAEIRIAPSLATIQYDSSSSSSKNELFINLKQSESYTFSYESSSSTLKLIKGTLSKTNAKSVLIPFKSNLEFPYTFSDEDVIEIKSLSSSSSSIYISITMPTDKFTTFITPRMRFNNIYSSTVNMNLGYTYSSLVFNPVYSEVQLTFNIQSNMPGNVVFNELELVGSGGCVVKYSSNNLKYQIKRLKLNNNYNGFRSTNVQIGTLDLYGSASIMVNNLRSANLSSPAGLITMHNKENKFPSMSLEKDSNPNQLRPSSIRIDISASNWDISDSEIWMFAHPDDTFNAIPHNDYVTKTNIVYGPTTDFDCNKWISIVSINNPVVNVQGVEFEYSLRCTRANYSTDGFVYDEKSNSFYQYSYLELISRVLSVTDSFDHAEVVNKTLSGGAIAGISISVIIVVAVIVGLIIFFVILKKCHKQRENSNEEGEEKEEINEKEEESKADEESESN